MAFAEPLPDSTMPELSGRVGLTVLAWGCAIAGVAVMDAWLWTIESDTPSGWFDFVTLSREDVVRLCGRWPRDEDPAAH